MNQIELNESTHNIKVYKYGVEYVIDTSILKEKDTQDKDSKKK